MQVFFDFDGPIVDLFDSKSNREVAVEVIQVCSLFGCEEISIENIGVLSLWARLREQMSHDIRSLAELDRQVHLKLEEHEALMLSKIAPDRIAVEMLSESRRLFSHIGVVSNNSKKPISEWLALHDLDRFIDIVVGRTSRDSFISLKPETKGLLGAIQTLNGTPESSLYIGDTEADESCCRKANVAFIGLLTRHSPAVQRQKKPFENNWLRDRSKIKPRLILEAKAREGRLY